MSGHPGAVLCGLGHGAVDHDVQGNGQLFEGYPIVVKGHYFLAARKTPTSYAPVLHQTPLLDTVLSPATALAAVKGVLVTGSETIGAVLGLTSVVSTLSHRLGAVLAAEAEENKSVVSVPAVLFFMMLTFVKSTFDYLKSTLIIHDLQKHSSALDPVLPSPIMNGTAPLQSDQQQGTVNTKEGHFECSICYKLISTKKGLENHINQVHNKFKRFLCKQGEDSLAYFLTICTDLRVTTITCLRSSDSI